MSRDPISDDCREFAGLQCETTVLPWGDSKRILVQANVGAVIARIEPPIQSRLREEIHLRTRLRVQKQRETRIEEIVDFRINEARRRLFEIIKFQIDSAAQS